MRRHGEACPFGAGAVEPRTWPSRRCWPARERGQRPPYEAARLHGARVDDVATSLDAFECSRARADGCVYVGSTTTCWCPFRRRRGWLVRTTLLSIVRHARERCRGSMRTRAAASERPQCALTRHVRWSGSSHFGTAAGVEIGTSGATPRTERLLVSSDHARHLVTLVRSDTTRARGFAQPAICRAAPDAGFSRWPHRISGFRAAKQRSPWHAGAPRVAQHSTPYQGREFHSHVARYSNGCFPRGRQQSLEP